MSRCIIADGILFGLYDFSQSLYFNLKYIYLKILARLCVGVAVFLVLIKSIVLLFDAFS